MKQYKSLLITTSVIILLPILVGLLLWSQLPEQLPTHWNAAGEIDDYSSKSFGIFFVPCFLLTTHWLCAFASLKADPKGSAHTKKMLSLVLWIIPVLSILIGFITYATALGMHIDVERVMPIAIGLMFVIIGNYMPKFKQNYTIGVKLPWTLNSEENWNRTHRFSGKLWVIGGLVMMIAGFLNWFIVLLVAMIALTVVPVGYSYWLFRKGI